MKTRVLAYLLAAVVALAGAIAPCDVAAKINHQPIDITLDGTTQPIANTAALQLVQSRKITIQSRVGNAATVYVGHSDMTGADDALYSLAPGQGVTLLPSKYEDAAGQRFALSDWYVRGTAADVVLIAYEIRQ